jgi:hypothetical protein
MPQRAWNETRERQYQLLNEEGRRRGVKGRSKMSKQQFSEAVGR